MKKVKVNELFSGIGTQSLAFEYTGIPHEVVGIAEICPNAIKAYNELHGETKNYGDISQIERLDYADFWTYSFPCFVGETEVTTEEGYKRIDEINIGDKVVTHRGRVRKVTAVYQQGIKEISIVSVRGIGEIRTTSNHKFYVIREWEEKPEWLEVKDIRQGDLVGVGIHALNWKYLRNVEGLSGVQDIGDVNIWVPVEEISIGVGKEEVYDISVEEDTSFLAQGVAVHNCQDLSTAGKGAGMVEGTRSGLLWEVERLLATSVEEKDQPKYLLLENVPTLLQKKHLPLFNKWLGRLEDMGYKNYYGTMNSRDYGVPQNRDRVFVVSIREDIEREFYFFNIPRVATPAFTNFLDPETRDYRGPFKIDETISPSVVESYEEELDQIKMAMGKGIYRCNATSGFQDKVVGIEYSPTLRHQNTHTAVLYNNQIHKLTGREAWMFMGIKGDDYDRVVEGTGLSNNVLSGLAGNAIVVDVLKGIYKELFVEGEDY